MPDMFFSIVRAVRAVSKVSMSVSQVLLAVLFFLSVADVAGRYLFNYPLVGTLELSEILLVGIVFFGSAYTLYLDKQITMDMLYSRLPTSIQKYVDILTRLFSLTIFILMLWKVTATAFYFKDVHRLVPTLFWPIYPFVLFISFGVLMISLELIIEVVFLIVGVQHEDGK